MVTGDAGGEVVVWGRHEERPRLRLTGHAGPVWAVAVSPGWPDHRLGQQRPQCATLGCGQRPAPRHIARPLRDRGLSHIRLRRADAGFGRLPESWRQDLGSDSLGRVPVARLAHPPIEAVGFSSDGQEVLALARGGQMRLCDLRSGVDLARQHTDQTGAWKSPAILAAFDPTSRVLAGVGSDGRTAYVWDVAAGRPRHQLVGHAEPIDAVALSSNGAVVATAGGWSHLPPQARDARAAGPPAAASCAAPGPPPRAAPSGRRRSRALLQRGPRHQS